MEKLKSILGTILGIDIKDVNDGISPQNTPSWDSMNSLLIVTELERTYGIKLTIDDVMDMQSVGKIKEILIKHNIKSDEN